MKLNKFFFGLLMTPAVMMVGCSDYEDTEVASRKQMRMQLVLILKAVQFLNSCHRGQTSFKIVLNRASFSEAVNVPVKATDPDNFFSLSDNQFDV